MQKAYLRACLALSVFLLASSSTVAAAKIIYVDADAAGVGNGSSWADAYNFLQDALADANTSEKPVEIRVAQGTYRPDEDTLHPDGTGDCTATFRLITGVTIKGGFAGIGQQDPNTLDIQTYETILNGDLSHDDVDINDPCDLFNDLTRFDNSYHIVTGSDTDATAILDGLTVTSGNANREWPIYFGGGIFIDSGSPTLLNCRLRANVAAQAGGLYIGSGSPKINNCTFSDNAAKHAGGMMNAGTNTTLTNCMFMRNFAATDGGATICANAKLIGCTFIGNSAGYEGGAIDNDCSAPTLDRCVFIENTAGASGGAISNYEGDLNIVCCTFTGNSARYGGAIYQGDTDSILIGCRFIGNSASTGGAIANDGYSDPTLTNCVFSTNSADVGGAFYNTTGSAPKLINCTFYRNSASKIGGGMCISNNYGFSPELTNCTFSSNSAIENGGAIYLGEGAAAIVTNCILWDDTPQEVYMHLLSGVSVATYSNIQDGWPGVTNTSVDPCFARPGYWDPNGTPDEPSDDFWVDGDYHLKSQGGRYNPATQSWVIDELTSPCIDAGNPMSPIGHEPFPNGGIVNMGAYGSTQQASKSDFGKPRCETIIAGDINGDCVIDFKDLRIMALHWCEDNNP